MTIDIINEIAGLRSILTLPVAERRPLQPQDVIHIEKISRRMRYHRRSEIGKADP